jgi:hypothetical protein
MTQRRRAQSPEPKLAEPGDAAVQRRAPGLQPQVQDHIGRQLRAVYDDLLNQPVPDRFKELMDKLDKKTGEIE